MCANARLDQGGVASDDDIAENVRVGERARKGFTLLALRSLVSRILAPLGQIVLARLLLPEDYGVIGLAYTVTTFAAVLQTSGVREILVRRYSHFRRWHNAAFWLALSLGILSSAVILIAAPMAGRFYSNSRLLGVLVGLSALPILNAASVIPQAHLQARLEFKAVFWIEMVNVIGWPLATVFCAWLGFGPYSFVIPQLLIAASSTCFYWKASGLSFPKSDWHLRRWRFLLGDVAMLLGSGGLLTIAGQMDRMILGRMTSAATVGMYYFAFAFAIQTIQLFSGSVVQVLMPALASLQGEPSKQRSAFERATAMVAHVAVPLCLLQGVLAEPLVLLLFGSKWREAAPLVQILCLGTAFDVVSSASHAAIRAQGRFRVVLFHALLSLTVFGASGVILTWRFGVQGMGWAFVANFAICTVFLTWQVYRPWRGSMFDALRLYLNPLFLSVMAWVPMALVAWTLSQFGMLRLYAVVAAAPVGVTAYAALLRRCRPDVWAEAAGRARRSLGKLPILSRKLKQECGE